MKVSIIVLTYNRVQMVTEAIDSILNQTFNDFELIIVDNYSSDNTESIIKSYEDKRIRYFKNQNNGVIAINLNYGINKAQGEYIAFCDDDDVWYPEKLEKCLKIFRENQDIILVCHDENITRNGKVISVSIYGPYIEPMYYNLLFKGCCLSSSAFIARKDKLLSVGGFSENPDFFVVEDYDLWMRLALVGKFYFLHEILGEFRLHDTNYSADIERRIRNKLNLMEHHFKQLSPEELRKHKGEIKRAKADTFFGPGWTSLIGGDFLRAKNWFKDGIKVYPLSLKCYFGFTLALLRLCPPQRLRKLIGKIRQLV